MRVFETILFLAIIGSFIIVEMRMDKLEDRLTKSELSIHQLINNEINLVDIIKYDKNNIGEIAAGLVELKKEDLYLKSFTDQNTQR